MILSNSKISARQLNRLILTAGTGTLMMLLPDVAGSGETGIVSLFVAFGITLVHLKIVFWLVEKSSFQTKRHDPCSDKETGITSNNQNRKEGRKTNLPKRKNGESMFGNGSFSVHIILNLASIIEFIKCLALSAGLLLAAANTVRTILLPGKSFALVAAVWLAGTAYLACAGTEARGRFAEAVWLIALIPLAFLLILCLAHIGKHGSITGGALISFETLEHNGAIILLRGILYSAVFAPVELIYWCRDKIAWDVPAGLPPKNTKRAISSAVCIVFLFAILFTAAAVGILGIQGIQATEHSAMAIAAGLDVMGAIVAQKQGIAVLFFLTGMLTASAVLLGQMGRFAGMAVEVISGEKEKRRGKSGRKNHVLVLCLAVLTWCVAAGLYGRFVNPTSGGSTAESGNNTGTADNVDTAENSGTSAASLTTTAQIEDRAYCTAIGIDLAEKFIFTMEIAQGSDMEASFVTCEADSLSEAAAIFNANSDRELDVSHLQILLLGNSLLESGTYKNMLLEFGDAAEYYFGGTLLAFTAGTAKEYMENYAESYDSEGTVVGMHLKKRFEQGLESEKAVLGTVYYRWINRAEEEPAEWIPTLTLD